MKYKVEILKDREYAKKISGFLLSNNAFEDGFTPGEIIELNENPLKSLEEDHFQYWYIQNENEEIVGIAGIYENEQKTGGYYIDYIAIHKKYRNKGFVKRLFHEMFKYVSKNNGRYIVLRTCDTGYYNSIRHILKKKEFIQVGHIPNYYFEGEGVLIYYKKIESDFQKYG